MKYHSIDNGETEMIPVKRLKKILQELPEDALAYAYEGEVIGIIFVSVDDQELGYIPTKETGSSDLEYVKTIYKKDAQLLDMPTSPPNSIHPKSRAARIEEMVAKTEKNIRANQ